MKRPISITAHRGARGLVKHENTLESFEKAIEVGAHAIEFDVRKSADDILFIHHDAQIDDVTLSTLSYQEIIKLAQKHDYIPPTLEEVLLAMKHRIFMDIELKEMGYEEVFIDAILKHLEPHMFYIRTFDDSSIRAIKKVHPEVTVGLLLGVETPKHGVWTRLGELFPLARIIKTRCDFISPHYRLVKFAYAFRMHCLKKPVYVWTVNDESLMIKMIKKHVDGLVTDYPNIALNLLKKAEGN
ncbi:MAG: glycerophosphodiester phosphodiesterase [Bacilli bacterium]|nr:glycerophosphodiester phosphodiesterase [Bacilli bacterium]